MNKEEENLWFPTLQSLLLMSLAPLAQFHLACTLGGFYPLWGYVSFIVQEQPACVVAPFLSFGRMHKMSLITVASVALVHDSDPARYIFSLLSKNIEAFFFYKTHKRRMAVHQKISINNLNSLLP